MPITRIISRLGVGGRLLLAFLGISGFAAVGAAAVVIAFFEISKVLDLITQERVPSALSAQAISRQAERVVSAAPMLLTADNEANLAARALQINAEVENLDKLIKPLETADFSPQDLHLIRDISQQLRTNLATLKNYVSSRLKRAADKRQAVSRVRGIYDQIQQLLEPWVLVTDAKIGKWHRAIGKFDASSDDRAAANTNLKTSLSWLRSIQKLQLLLTSVSEKVQHLANADKVETLNLNGIRLTLLMRKANGLVEDLDPKLQPRISPLLKNFEVYVVGTKSILRLRHTELLITSAAVLTIEQNAKLSQRLTKAVDELVMRARNDIAAANEEALSVQHVTMSVTISVVLLSLLCSALIVWLYVARNLVARLKALSDSMMAIAAGNLKASLPPAVGNDEISHMADALIVFRDTAIEVEEKNLREIEATRRRLVDAIESTTEGFALYDSQDRLELCNTKYEQMLYPGREKRLTPGTKFEDVVRQAAEGGLIPDAEGRIDDWVAERLRLHQNPGEPHLHQLRDGLWILISERRTTSGGTVAVYADISELKQREEELAVKSDALEAKSNALEQLSNQLAKYLSPQVYDSIFLGKQEVKVASRRKKLTVFFSDIANFTETADRLESEELTQLLNHYLTEMSQIALKHGATIDKYVGDAILIFFGDPETKGVREDALACVMMAIDMRERMLELEQVWRRSGIAKPLRVRTGIHTGFCTVGNFGSEDRMDYTIIGSAVNTASRLESLAEPGEILISYETYAHVKDKVLCSEQNEVEVKGLAYPVAAYQVIDTYDSLGKEPNRFRENLPNLKLDLDLDAMSTDERNRTVKVLHRALNLLSTQQGRSLLDPVKSKKEL